MSTRKPTDLRILPLKYLSDMHTISKGKYYTMLSLVLPTKKIGKNNPKAEQIKAEPEPTKVWAVNEPVTVKSELISEMPKKSELASKYLRLADIYTKLENQNTAIYQREQQLDCVGKELAGAKGIFKAKQRKELQEQEEQLQTQIASMKQYLSSIVQGYGYKNVKDFMAEFKASKAEYADYQSAVARWKQQTGNKAESDSNRRIKGT